jgi:AMP-binding enzyme
MRELAPNMSDYLATRASFRLEVPEVYNYARDVVDARAATEPDKLALLAVGPDGGHARRFSFADLAAASDRAARFLADQGVAKGDRVLVMPPLDGSCPRPSPARSAASSSASGNFTAAAEHPWKPGLRRLNKAKPRSAAPPNSEVMACASSRAVTASVLASVVC